MKGETTSKLQVLIDESIISLSRIDGFFHQ